MIVQETLSELEQGPFQQHLPIFCMGMRCNSLPRKPKRTDCTAMCIYESVPPDLWESVRSEDLTDYKTSF